MLMSMLASKVSGPSETDGHIISSLSSPMSQHSIETNAWYRSGSKGNHRKVTSMDMKMRMDRVRSGATFFCLNCQILTRSNILFTSSLACAAPPRFPPELLRWKDIPQRKFFAEFYVLLTFLRSVFRPRRSVFRSSVTSPCSPVFYFVACYRHRFLHRESFAFWSFLGLHDSSPCLDPNVLMT